MTIKKDLPRWIFQIALVLFVGGMLMLAPASVTVQKSNATVTNANTEMIDEQLCSLSSVECDMETLIKQIAEREEFEWPDYLVRLAKCESTLNPNAVGDGGYYSRGLYQISYYYHPDVSDECAFDVECSTLWTMEQINLGHQDWWSCNELI